MFSTNRSQNLVKLKISQIFWQCLIWWRQIFNFVRSPGEDSKQVTPSPGPLLAETDYRITAKEAAEEKKMAQQVYFLYTSQGGREDDMI